MNNQEIVEKLAEVKTILNERGWCKRTYIDLNGRHCIVGAVTEVTWNCDYLLDALRDNVNWGDNQFHSLVSWNDADSRRKRDVIRLIDRTIAKLQVNA